MTHKSGIQSVAFNPDGSLLAIGSLDRTARVCDARTGQEHFRVTYGSVGARPR